MTAKTERVEFGSALGAGLKSLGIKLSDAQRGKLWDYRELVVEANKEFNLTRITGPRDFAVKHHIDALAVLRWCRQSSVPVGRVLDVGTGAGVPAVSLAIAEPSWLVTALDGTGKKVRFVADVARALKLCNLSAIHGRAEEWRGEDEFDLVLFKAVGSLARCLAWARPHLMSGGRAIIYKTDKVADDEIAEARKVAKRLRYSAAKHFEYKLRDGDEERSRVLWIFRQVGH